MDGMTEYIIRRYQPSFLNAIGMVGVLYEWPGGWACRVHPHHFLMSGLRNAVMDDYGSLVPV